MARTVDGVVAKHPHGFGFVKNPDPGEEDVYVPAAELGGVMDGDRIRVELVRRRGRMAGRLVEVLSRRRRQVVGTFRPKRRAAWVMPLDPALEPVLVRVACEPAPEPGDVVAVRFTDFPSDDRPAEGEVVEVLGPGGDPMHEVLSIAYGQGFADAFPEDVAEESEGVPDRVRVEDLAGRRDLRELPLVTIDGADARDFDDAVFAERMPGGGYRLVVAIADVAHYVREGTALDREALARATSVYFPNRVLPMLPERLSNGICSLNPGVDRLCMVADLTLTAEGKTVNTEIYQAVMRSHARLTYVEVGAMMGEAEAPVAPEHRFWEERHLGACVELSRRLNARRTERGSIDLDLPEPQVVLDARHRPERIERRPRLWAHRMIEEFMLAANEAVAWFFGSRGLPTIYRVHDVPNEEKLAAFAALARAHGFALTASDEITPQQMNALLHGIAGRPEERALNHLLLRSMQKALYSAENIGHYGLGASHYLHFTSPIRRYPDLMVHRLLTRHWARAGRTFSERERRRVEEELEGVAAQSSERERAAMAAEREADDYFACLFMEDKVGETFSAVVAGVTDFGLFVELEDWSIQGLLKAELMGEAWSFDEERLVLTFGASGRRHTVGDRLDVVCASVNVARRQIDFDLASAQTVQPAAGPRRSRRPRRDEPEDVPAGRRAARAKSTRKPKASKGKAGKRKGPGKRPGPKRRR